MTKTFWLSFVGASGFLGVSVISVDDADATDIRTFLVERFPNHLPGAEWLAAALNKAHRLGCNPGGEVASLQCDDDTLDDVPHDRLMSAAELKELKLYPPAACIGYVRPEGVLGGPCLRCGRSQPEHAETGALAPPPEDSKPTGR